MLNFSTQGGGRTHTSPRYKLGAVTSLATWVYWSVGRNRTDWKTYRNLDILSRPLFSRNYYLNQSVSQLAILILISSSSKINHVHPCTLRHILKNLLYDKEIRTPVSCLRKRSGPLNYTINLFNFNCHIHLLRPHQYFLCWQTKDCIAKDLAIPTGFEPVTPPWKGGDLTTCRQDGCRRHSFKCSYKPWG